MEYSMNRRVMRAKGNYSPLMAPHNVYPCRGDDKWLSLAVESEEAWQALCRVAGHPEWAQDERFADMSLRLRNRRELDRLMGEWTREQDASALTEQLQGAGVAAMPVLNIEEMYFNPHHQARQTFIETEHPLVGHEPIYGFPWKLTRTPGRFRRPAPSLGEHNAYVLQDLLGMSGSAVAALEQEKALW